MFPLLRPGRYFQENSAIAWQRGVPAIVGVLLFFSIILPLIVWMNEAQIREAFLIASREALLNGGPEALTTPPTPFARLWFPVFWSVLFGIFLLLRRGVLAILRTAQIQWIALIGLSTWAWLLPICVAGFFNVLNDLFPFYGFDDALSVFRMFAYGFAILFAFAWEALIIVQGLRAIAEVRLPQAVLVAATPHVLGLALLGVLFFGALLAY